jgi:hypothetical protein
MSNQGPNGPNGIEARPHGPEELIVGSRLGVLDTATHYLDQVRSKPPVTRTKHSPMHRGFDPSAFAPEIPLYGGMVESIPVPALHDVVTPLFAAEPAMVPSDSVRAPQPVDTSNDEVIDLHEKVEADPLRDFFMLDRILREQQVASAEQSQTAVETSPELPANVLQFPPQPGMTPVETVAETYVPDDISAGLANVYAIHDRMQASGYQNPGLDKAAA